VDSAAQGAEAATTPGAPRRLSQSCFGIELLPCLVLVNWRQVDLAKASGVSEIAIKNLERGATDPRVSTLAAIQVAFDKAGVVFLDPGDTRNGGQGVRLKGKRRG
jgi:transcriptional regulator with XRE-family HTH domain